MSEMNLPIKFKLYIQIIKGQMDAEELNGETSYDKQMVFDIATTLSDARDEVERLDKKLMADREVHDFRIARARKAYSELQKDLNSTRAELERLRGEG